MSYNSLSTAKNIVSVDLSQTLLDVATSMIHMNTPYRWAATAIVRRFSGDGTNVIYLGMPVTTFTYLKEIDEENSDSDTLDMYDDYEYDKETGRLQNYGGFTAGYNNYEVSYTYGYTETTDARYHTVLYIEAAVALMLKKNPLLLASVSLAGGDHVAFKGTQDGDALWQLLQNVPRPLQSFGLGGMKSGTDNFEGLLIRD